MLDYGLRNGKPHGTTYRIDIPGRLLSATPYGNGREHGLARQWSDAGHLIGTYRMRRGTGVDLWWSETWTKPRRPYLSEVHFMRKGRPDGYEWWLKEDQESVYQERHWRNGQLHGIEREWTPKGKLRRGFPRFYVEGKRATRQTYERERAHDSTLPAFRPADNRPQRRFPPLIARHLARPYADAGSRARHVMSSVMSSTAQYALACAGADL